MIRFLRFVFDFAKSRSVDIEEDFAAAMADAGMVSEESVECGHPADLALAFVAWRFSVVVEPRPAWLRYRGERRL